MSKLSATGAVIMQAPPSYLHRDPREPYSGDDFAKLCRYQPGKPVSLHAAMTELVRQHGAGEVLRAARIAAGDRDEDTLDAAKRELEREALRGRG